MVESYALLLAALLLMGGSLGDLYGRRKIFVAGVVLFTVASAWCGLASNIRQLIVAQRPPRNRRSAAGPRQPGSDQRHFLQRASAVAPSGRGLVSRRSPPRSVPCWVDGCTSTVRGDGCSSSIFRWGWPFWLALWKVPESRAGQQAHGSTGWAACWPRSASAASSLRLIESVPVAGAVGAIAADCAVVLGSALTGADGSAPSVPFPQFQREPTC